MSLSGRGRLQYPPLRAKFFLKRMVKEAEASRGLLFAATRAVYKNVNPLMGCGFQSVLQSTDL
jgi:hypothetical protein